MLSIHYIHPVSSHLSMNHVNSPSVRFVFRSNSIKYQTTSSCWTKKCTNSNRGYGYMHKKTCNIYISVVKMIYIYIHCEYVTMNSYIYSVGSLASRLQDYRNPSSIFAENLLSPVTSALEKLGQSSMVLGQRM